MEKRKRARSDTNLPVMFTNSGGNPFCYYGATVSNYSRNGIGLVSPYAMLPGASIFIKSSQLSVLGEWGRDRQSIELNVRWCQPKEVNGRLQYGLGAVPHVSPASGCRPLIPETGLDPMNDNSLLYDYYIQGKPLASRKAGPFSDLNNQQTEETRIKHLVVSNQVASIISSSLELQDVLDAICAEMVKIFDVRNAGIGLVNERTNTIEIVAFRSIDPLETSAKGLEIPITGNAATRFVIENRQTIIVPDAQSNPIVDSFHQIASRRHTHCIMIVPLMTKDKVIGTIGLPALEDRTDFSVEDVFLAQTIASHVTGAIENANLYRKTIIQKEVAERELEIAREIQAGFFPEGLPVLRGWDLQAYFVAARQAAGDFYDVIPVDGDQKIGLLVGDVCDKGIGAAIFMALIRSLIRSFLQYAAALPERRTVGVDDTPAMLRETLAYVNDYVAMTHSSASMFATVFLGILNLENGALQYINAGHEPPYLISDGKLIRLNPTGAAIGMFPDLTFSVSQCRLGPNDLLLLYTDGVTELEDTDGNLFTKERLAGIMTRHTETASGLIRSIVAEMASHAPPARVQDDVTIVAIKRDENMDSHFCRP